MIKHIVMFKLKENAEGKTKQETIVEAKKRLSVFEAEIPTLKKLVVAINDADAGTCTTPFQQHLFTTRRQIGMSRFEHIAIFCLLDANLA